MEDQKETQNKSLEMSKYQNIYENNNFQPLYTNKSKNKIFQDKNKENYDINKPYLISDNSVSAINPLSKSRENLNTSNSIINTNNLFIAVEYNDIQRVSELLKQDNSKINELNEEGLSLLHIAVIKANLKMINLLLSYGADPNILSNKKNQTPLHIAYLNQNSLTEEIIQELRKYNATDNIYDSKNKKPSDYLCSSYKKNKNRQLNIYSNNEYYNSPDKKNYLNNNTGNTVTIVTIDNHLDSFLTTNKEDENKSNHNNINTNSNNTIVQTPTKLDVDYDFNEIVSLNNSVEKSGNQINNKFSNNNLEENKNKDNDGFRRQYTFGKEEYYQKFRIKNNNDLSIDVNNINNSNNKVNNLDNIDINNNYYFENLKKENNKEKKIDSYKEDLNKISNEKENELLNDSLEEENLNEEEDEKKDENNHEKSKDSYRNNNNKDNNTQNSFNLNNNSLTYTDSININSSYFETKNKKSNIPNGTNSKINEDINNEQIILKSPCNDKKINFNIDNKNNSGQDKEQINDILLTKIITRKMNSNIRSHKLLNLSKTYNNSMNMNTNGNFRHSAYNNSDFNLKENDISNSSLKSNKTNRTNYLHSKTKNNNSGENKNNIKYLYKQKKRFIYNNNLINHNNSYKNSNTIIHKGTLENRIGFSGDITQYSTQSQNNKRRKMFSSKDRIKVIMNDNNSIPNNFNINKITEFNISDNINNNNNINNDIILNNETNKNNNLINLKLWLNNLGLVEFLNNFTNNNIFDINNLVERMKLYQTKLNYDSLESILKIRKPGYIYRILCKLEADAGLIDSKIVKFMIREQINDDSKNNMNRSTNNNDINLNISVSDSYYLCFNCCKINNTKKQKKNNDLKYFLLRYDLTNLYKNFYYNGFDMIEYVIIQMYSSFPITDDILENYLHIYDEKQRIKTLKAIVTEMKIINRFMNSDEYNNYFNKNIIKYDNVIFEENENKQKTKISINNNDKNNSDCILF